MAIPPSALPFAGSLDPQEELDFILLGETILETGEQITAGYTLEVLAEGTALGLEIMSGDGRDDERINSDRDIKFWLHITSGFENNAAFDGDGAILPMRITLTTNSNPARTRQRTFLVPVKQQ